MKILKSTLMGLCNLLGFSLTLHAQVLITESTPLHEQIEDALAPLDMGDVTTHILFDKGMDFYDWTQFGDNLPPDSLATKADDWGWHFAQVASSCLDEYDPLPDPDNYLNIMSGLDESSTSIPIVSMLVDYHRFHPDAIGLGLLTYDSINQTFHNVSGQNPYLRDTFFVATLLGKEVYAGTIDIVLPDSLQMGNLSAPDSMEIDLGQGWTTVGYNQAIPVTYSAGEQYISLRFNLSDGSQWYAKTRLTVHPVVAESSPPSNGEYSDSPDITITDITEVDGASFDIFYGNDCEELLKPFIFIEGFNPSQFNDIQWDEMQEKLSATFLNGQEIDTPTGNTLWQDLYNEGYDLIYVDFDDGAGDILYNASVVEDIINWVNDEKASNGSVEKNIVMGVSMGGIIGFRALRTMEVNSIDHQTETFISYDSPFYGANLPLGLQFMVNRLGNFHISNSKGNINDVEPKLKIAEDVLLSPAAKQMLYYHAYAPGITAWHDNFYNALHADGPLEVRHIAISNGSSIGENQVLSSGEQYLNLSGHQGDGLAGLIIDFSEVYAMNPPTAGWKVLYKHRIGKRILQTIFWHTYEVKNIGLSNLYDSAPGGVHNMGLDNTFGGGVGRFQVNLTNKGAFDFIPTVSGLNIAGYPDPMTDLNGDCSGSNLYRCIASVDNSVVLRFTNSQEHNQEHVSLNSDIATFLLYFVKKGSNESEINPLTDRTFNFGETDEELEIDLNVLKFYSTIDLIDFNLLVEEQGRLWVNRDDRIDFTDIQANPFNNSSYHFDLFIKKNICNSTSTTVTIQSGGELIAGDWDGSTNTASIFIEDGATLLIKDGGFVSADKNSEIVINDGGKLKIEDGGNLRASLGAQVIVEEGGVFEIDEGAEIDLWWATSTIHIKNGGELIINGEFDFEGSGFFQFDEDHILTLNADFVLHGQGDRFIRLNEGAELNIGDRLIDLKRGKVEYAEDTRIEVGPGGSVRAEDVDFEGIAYSEAPDNNYAFYIQEANAITIISSSFKNLTAGISADNNFEPADFQVHLSLFENCEVGIAAERFENIHVVETEFLNETVPGSLAVWFDDVNRAGLTSCTVEGYETNGAPVAAVYLNNVGDMYLTGTDITENEVGIILEDVTSLRVFGGQINYNGTGIRAPLTTFSEGENVSNVFLFSHAQVSYNDIGIEIEKGGEIDEDEYYGMVLMDCAELSHNADFGIIGDDIILQIDAFINAGGGDLRPNKIYDNEVSFDICYIDLSDEVSTLTPATGNYWGSTWPPTNFKVNKTNCGTWGGLDTGLPVTTEPTSCDDGGLAEPNDPPLTVNPGFTGNPSEMCSLNIGGSNIDVHEEFIDAYDHFRAGWHTLAGQKFEPIASITGSDHLNATAMCKQYINVSKVMARGVPLLLMPSNDDGAVESQEKTLGLDTKEEKDNFGMKVYPNPAKSQFRIELDDGDFEIRIFNTLGIEKYFTKKNSSVEISTTDWPAGIYWIEVVDLETEKQLNGKVVVQ